MGSGSLLQFALLFVCWLAALATLLVFLETWFGFPAVTALWRAVLRRLRGYFHLCPIARASGDGGENPARDQFDFRTVLSIYRTCSGLLRRRPPFCGHGETIPQRPFPYSGSPRLHGFPDRYRQRPYPRAGAGSVCRPWPLVCDPGFGCRVRPVCGRDGAGIRRIQRNLGVDAATRRALPVASAENHRAVDGAHPADGPHRQSAPRTAKRNGVRILLPASQSRSIRGHQQDQPHARVFSTTRPGTCGATR